MYESRRNLIYTLASSCLLLAGCAHSPPTIEPVDQVDLPRFMGDWYVIAHIPSRPERNAYNAIESYELKPNGRVQTTFQYRNGSFDAPLKTMRPQGFVRPDTNNAVWDMQFVWPIKAEYVIVDLDPAYSLAIIGRSKRDYAWIMARTSAISDADYASALARLRALGYSLGEIRRLPQKWPEPSGARPK